MEALVKTATGDGGQIEKSYSVDTLADLLDMKPRTIRQHYYDGRLIGFRVGNLVRFRQSDVGRWLAECNPLARA